MATLKAFIRVPGQHVCSVTQTTSAPPATMAIIFFSTIQLIAGFLILFLQSIQHMKAVFGIYSIPSMPDHVIDTLTHPVKMVLCKSMPSDLFTTMSSGIS